MVGGRVAGARGENQPAGGASAGCAASRVRTTVTGATTFPAAGIQSFVRLRIAPRKGLRTSLQLTDNASPRN
jgi:hypothetical protein